MTDRRFVRRRALRGLVALSVLALALVLLPGGFAAKSSSRAAMAAPLGFQPQTVVSGLNLPTSFAFAPDGRIFIAEKSGVVRVFKNGALLSTPVIDISAKVNNYWDRGLIGMALDPNFTTNGFVYLLYPYDASPTDDAGTKTARLSRYTVVGDTALPSTERIILGTNVGSACTQFPVGSDCIPAEWYGHGVGDIHFGSDGSMFLSNGDAANWDIVSDEAARAQDLNSLAGKIMRIDPNTGQGLPDNPYWNGDPNAARSKVWAYGVRNAYRFSVRPNSGAPGTVYAGDVGWGTAEEVNVVPKGANLGWPCYEGSAVQAGYQFKPVCQALYTAVAADPSKWTKPIITWDHNGAGSAVTGGAFNTGTAYPAAYQGVYFFGDYARNQLPLCEHRHERRRHIRADRLRCGGRLAGRHPGRTGRQPLLPGDRLGTADQVRVRRSPVRVRRLPQRPRLDVGDERLGARREGQVERRAGSRRRRADHPQRRCLPEGPRDACRFGGSLRDLGLHEFLERHRHRRRGRSQRIGRLPGLPGRDEGVRQRHDERRLRDQERQPRPDRKERASSRRHERRRQQRLRPCRLGQRPTHLHRRWRRRWRRRGFRTDIRSRDVTSGRYGTTLGRRRRRQRRREARPREPRTHSPATSASSRATATARSRPERFSRWARPERPRQRKSPISIPTGIRTS